MGDSFTYGIGADSSGAYPVALQRLVNEKYPDGVRIVNLGHPYMDSTSLLVDLPRNVRNWHPDAVVLLVGYNNRFREHVAPSETGWRAFLKRHFGRFRLYQLAKIIWINMNVDPNARIDARVPPLQAAEIAGVLEQDDRLDAVRKAFAAHAERGEALTKPNDDAGDAALAAYAFYRLTDEDGAVEAEAAFREVLDRNPDDLAAAIGGGYIYLYRHELVMGFRKARFSLDSSWLFSGMGYLMMDLGRLDLAARYLLESMKFEPSFVTAPHGLAMTYLRMGRPDEAMFYLLAAESIEPWSPEIQWTKGDVLLSMGDGEGAAKAYERSLEFSHFHPGHYARIARMWAGRPKTPDAALAGDEIIAAAGPRSTDWRQIGAWTRKTLAERTEARAVEDLLDDLDDIADALAESGTRLILMSYPDQFYREELAGFARSRGLTFVDHVPAFEDALKMHSREELFRPDSHCTNAGYAILAKNVFDTLDREGLLRPRDAQ
jgi:tetratricopeptide (TPR) repeat protein